MCQGSFSLALALPLVTQNAHPLSSALFSLMLSYKNPSAPLVGTKFEAQLLSFFLPL